MLIYSFTSACMRQRDESLTLSRMGTDIAGCFGNIIPETRATLFITQHSAPSFLASLTPLHAMSCGRGVTQQTSEPLLVQMEVCGPVRPDAGPLPGAQHAGVVPPRPAQRHDPADLWRGESPGLSVRNWDKECAELLLFPIMLLVFSLLHVCGELHVGSGHDLKMKS